MKPIIATTSLLILGITGTDAMVYNGTEIEQRTVSVAEELVKVEQIKNVVSTELPWKGEQGITVKYDLGEPTLDERLADQRKQEVITETVEDFDGGFKVDILLNEKPDTNVFCYQIDGAENYDFFYQPALTQEEIERGSIRPPEIVGSYAVYHKALSNHRAGETNYATGKVMHIPRPQVWSLSDEENKEWADLNYDDGNLCVTVPQTFLDTADYPVRVDPTFGYTSIGASASTFPYESIEAWGYIGTMFTLTEDGDVSKVTAHIYEETDVGTYKGLIYDDSNADAPPNAQKAIGSEASLTTTPSWVDSTLTVSLTAGDYFLGVTGNHVPGNADVLINYDTASEKAYECNIFSYAPPPDPFSCISSPGALTHNVSIYATYTVPVPEPDPRLLRINNGTININNGAMIIQ